MKERNELIMIMIMNLNLYSAKTIEEYSKALYIKLKMKLFHSLTNLF